MSKPVDLTGLEFGPCGMVYPRTRHLAFALDARGLHEFLGSKQDFSTWIKRRIKEYEFIQDTDFVPFHQVVERAMGCAARTEYMITIDITKELSMLERNEKGR